MTVVDFCDQKYILNEKRISFYNDHLSVGDFNKLFNKEFPLESPTLPFIEKFKMMVSKNPDLEIWTTLYYYHYVDKVIYRSFNYSVSTSGRVYSHFKDKIRNFKIEDDGYLYGYYHGKYFTTHRIVLSSFTLDLKEIVNKIDLTVNHIDHIRDNNDLLNLEWLTMVENIKAAVPKSDPLKITVMIDKLGIPEGTVFYIPTRAYLRKLGISPREFKSRSKCSITYYGLKIETVDTCVETDIPNEFINHFSNIIPI